MKPFLSRVKPKGEQVSSVNDHQAMSKTREEFTACRDAVIDTLREASNHWCVWKGIYGGLSRHEKAINLYSGFFNPTWHGHLSLTIIAFSKLYDKRSDAYGLKKLMEIAQGEPMLFSRINPSQIKEIVDRVAALESFVGRIKVIRHKTLAHRANLTRAEIEEVCKQNSFKIDEVEKALKELEDCINKLSSAFDGNHFVVEAMNIRDVDHLIDAIGDCYLKKHEERSRKLDELRTKARTQAS